MYCVTSRFLLSWWAELTQDKQYSARNLSIYREQQESPVLPSLLLLARKTSNELELGNFVNFPKSLRGAAKYNRGKELSSVQVHLTQEEEHARSGRTRFLKTADFFGVLMINILWF